MSNSPDFRWSSYLDLARELSERPNASEASLRSAISRAYYAAFHAARRVLLAKGVQIPDHGDAHGRIWHECRSRQGRELRPVGIKGRALRDDRDSADYEDSFHGDIEEATRYALINAEWIVRQTEAIWEAIDRQRRSTEQ